VIAGDEGAGAPWWNEGPFLYVGRMAASKGVPEILGTWLALRGRLGDRCPDLWLAGGAPAEIAAIRGAVGDELLRRDEALGRLRWWGYLDEAGLSALLLKARVLLMHSAYEPGGRVVLEAMTEGVPVIATPHGFARDLVRDWVTGFLIPNGDLTMLERRMEHFALQPFLGPSLGAAAAATARAALESWAFYRTHGATYAQFAFGADPDPLGAPSGRTELIRDPLPCGLAGRYPFAALPPDNASAKASAARLLGLEPEQCTARDLPGLDGKLEWAIEAGGKRYRMIHLASRYLRRPLWDRGHLGPCFASGRDRRRREAEAATLPGFRPLAVDEAAGLLLETEEAMGEAGASGYDDMLVALRALWSHSVEAGPAAALRSASADWWARREQRPWHSNPLQAACLRQASLRIAWAETADKLRTGEIDCGDDVRRAFAAAGSAEAITATEDGLVPLCWQHGEPGPARLRIGAGGPSLSGGEDLALGWWGRDAALAMLRFGDAADEEWRGHCLAGLAAEQDQARLVLLWGAVEAALALAECLTMDCEPPLRPARLCALLAAAVADDPSP
jgi:hypothetical protein